MPPGRLLKKSFSTIVWVEVFDIKDKTVKKISKDECVFGYRISKFKSELDRYVILRVAFHISKNKLPNLSYKDVREAFSENTTPTPQEIREKIIAIRSNKFPNLSLEGTAGSFFLNPTISAKEVMRISNILPGIPQFVQLDGRIKISLAYMLEKGLGLKGFRVGGARLFERQPLVLVADFGASSSDVLELCNVVQKKVHNMYGIFIEPEVRIV